MVLNRRNEREKDAHRRDALAGIEALDEAEIERLKESCPGVTPLRRGLRKAAG